MPHTLLSDRLNLAIQRATVAHHGHYRKGTDTPYIVHPFAVMTIASRVTDDEDTLIACLLHDTLEDVPDKYSHDDMRRDFGDTIVRIVEGVTKDNSIPDWRARNEAYLAHLRTASDASVIVSGADKIHNLQSILTDYQTHGETLWDRFNAGKHEQLWWYESVAEVLGERLPGSPLHQQLRALVNELEVITT